MKNLTPKETANDFNTDEASDIIIAEGLGWKAFSEGIMAGAHDPELCELIAKHKVAGQMISDMAIILMKAWNKGKTAASVAA